MKAELMLKLKVMDVTNGASVGFITGILLDADKKQVVALEVGGGLLSHPNYLLFGGIKSMENDVLTISSTEVFVKRSEFETSRLVGNLKGHNVFTEDGKNIGSIYDYDIDTKNGELTCITVAIGGFLSIGEKHSDIPRNLIVTLGDSVVVDSSVGIQNQ